MHKEPKWVTEARANYTGGAGQSYSETDFSRGRIANQILETKVLPAKEGIVDILLIGVGVDGNPIYGSSEPYRISGFLEAKNRDYRMTIVDKDPSVIDDIQSRKKVFMSNSIIFTDFMYGEDWDSFLKDTKQKGKVVHKVVDGLDLAENVLKDKKMLAHYLKEGFRAAEVPKQFKNKLESGEISLVNADIANADLSSKVGFDFVSCPNVLYLLPADGQKLAMYNIAMNTKKGGLILTNDLGYTDNPILPRHGGWFTENKQRELGLVVDEILSSDSNCQTLLFRKK